MTAQAIINVYNCVGSIRKTAAMLCISYQTVRKTLATVGIYSSRHGEDIATRHAQGVPVTEIAATVGVKPRTIRTYLPYCKAPYYLDPDDKTPNARMIAAFRARRKIMIDKAIDAE